MSKLPGYESVVICPYNKSHVILQHRFQTHLAKCERSHPHIKYEVCPFDATHRYPKEDEKKHIEECPARESVDRYFYSVDNCPKVESGKMEKKQPVPLPPQRTPGEFEEDWDHFDCPTYEPKKYAENAPVLRAPGLMTPSERRQFADAERKRLSDLNRCQ